MGLTVECPKCKNRNSDKAKTCTGKRKDGTLCGFPLTKHSGKVWWIDYRVDGERKRERIGPNKAAAEQRYREVKSLIAEGRFIKKNPEIKTSFKTPAQWYLDLPDVKAKRSYDRDKLSLDRLLTLLRR